MALTAYLAQTRRLLLNPPATTQLYSDSDLKAFINTARAQIAGEGECIRVLASLNAPTDTRVLNFADIDVSAVEGVQSVFNIKQITCQVGSGATFVHPRSFQWFNMFFLAKITPNSGRPNTYALYGQGTTGSIYIDPVPNVDYTLNLDTVCKPVDLVDDTTAEAIPYPWTDCVPFFAAYYAYLSAQRKTDAQTYYQIYEEYMNRARAMSNPSVLTSVYPQAPDPTVQNKLGVQPAQRGGR